MLDLARIYISPEHLSAVERAISSLEVDVNLGRTLGLDVTAIVLEQDGLIEIRDRMRAALMVEEKAA